MGISFAKVFPLLESKGKTAYSLRKDKVLGKATIEKLQKGEGNLDTRSIENICRYLDCQPGDIMEYIREEH